MSERVVLLVEPEGEVRRTMVRAFEHLGMRVHACSGHAEALTNLRAFEVHVVVAATADDAAEAFAILELAREQWPLALRALMAGHPSERIAAAERDGLVQHLLLKPFGMSAVTAMLVAAGKRS